MVSGPALRSAALVAGILALLGCTPVGIALPPIDGAQAADRIAVRNATSGVLTVIVNGAPAGMVAAGTDSFVSLLGRGGPPYRIDLRTPGGTLVMDFQITAEDHRQVVAGQTSSGVGGSTECGWVELAYGSDQFSAQDPAAPAPTAGGVCP